MYQLVVYFKVIELISFVDESLKLKLRENCRGKKNHVFTCWEQETTRRLHFSSQIYRLDAKRTERRVIMVCLYCKVAARFIAGSKQRGLIKRKGSCVKLPLCDEAPTVSHVCIS